MSVLWARKGGESYPEAAELEAGVGPEGCSNPFGAAGLCAPWAAWTRSGRRRSRVGTAGRHPPEQDRCSWRAVSAPAGASAPGAPSGLSRPRAPHRFRRPLRRGRSEAVVGPSWAPGGSRGRCGSRTPAAGDCSPPLQRQRLEKEGVRLQEGRMRGEIRLGNQEKGREGERRLHMTSLSQ